LSGEFPSAVAYYQQRLGFANTDEEPEKVFFSRSGDFKDFSVSSPVQDDDAVSFELAGREVNEIRHLLDLGTLLVFTTGGEFNIQGDSAGTLIPTAVNARQQAYHGSSILKPLIAGESALFVQNRGNVVRDLAFQFNNDRHLGSDLTIFSTHLFQGFTLRDWTFQENPNSTVWAVRSDGVLLGMTFVREHQLFGWHRHDFQGDTVEQVAAVPEGVEDALYIVVKRTLSGLASFGGSSRRYVERLDTRAVEEDTIEDYVGMDSTLTYDGAVTGKTVSLSTGTGWLYTDTITATASAATFSSTDVGKQLRIVGSDGTIIRMSIDAFSSTTVVTGKPNKTVPASMQGVAISEWAIAIKDVAGLWHIEGEDISVLGDGFVEGSPNNAAYTKKTVSSGKVTLDRHYAVIQAGLPVLNDLGSLDIDSTQGETMMDKRKLISEVFASVEKSRGMWVGVNAPTDDTVDPLERLTELKIREKEGYDDPVQLATETVGLNITGEWSEGGQVFIRQVDPVPLTILALVPAGLVPIG
jgi:hypothetical protein